MDEAQNFVSKTDPALNSEKDELTFGMDFFYKTGADTAVRLNDGRTLKFNKAALIFQSKTQVLYQVFFGVLKDAEVTEILDFDHDTFKLFLDCIMEFEPYNFENALKIFPAVWKYQIPHATRKCVAGLILSKNSENSKICELLNMSAIYDDCQELVKQSYDWVFSNRNIYKFVEDCCDDMAPNSMKIIFLRLNLDSYLLEVLMKWACNYLLTHDFKPEMLEKFLKDNDLLQFFKLDCFESAGALYKLFSFEIVKKLFSADKILSYLQESDKLLHGNSKWLTVKKDDTVTEEIIFPTRDNAFISDYNFHISIGRNKMVIYDMLPKNYSSSIICDLSLQVIGVSKGNKINLGTYNIVNYPYDTEIKYLNFYWPIDIRNSFCSIDSNVSYYPKSTVLESIIFKMTWKFFNNGRVLLMNRQGDKLNGSEKFYFSRIVSTI